MLSCYWIVETFNIMPNKKGVWHSCIWKRMHSPSILNLSKIEKEQIYRWPVMVVVKLSYSCMCWPQWQDIQAAVVAREQAHSEWVWCTPKYSSTGRKTDHGIGVPTMICFCHQLSSDAWHKSFHNTQNNYSQVAYVRFLAYHPLHCLPLTELHLGWWVFGAWNVLIIFDDKYICLGPECCLQMWRQHEWHLAVSILNPDTIEAAGIMVWGEIRFL